MFWITWIIFITVSEECKFMKLLPRSIFTDNFRRELLYFQALTRVCNPLENKHYSHAPFLHSQEAALTRDTPRHQIRGEGMHYLLSGTMPAWAAWELPQENKSTAERRNIFPCPQPGPRAPAPATSQAEHSVKFLWSPPIKLDATDRYTQHPGAR